MQDFSISKSTRRCAISGRTLEPAETYVSVIVPDGADVKRIDIASDQWTGKQENAIGWWRNKMPAAEAQKSRPAPNGVLLDTLSELLERPGKEPLAYLLALLLIRRRVLQEEQQLPMAEGTENKDVEDKSAECWNLVCPADGRQWNVPLAVPEADSYQQLQDELKGLLFTDG